jgi:flagellar hook assembly protein FlgD
VFALRIPLEKKLFTPNTNSPAVFPVVLDTRDTAGTVYLTVTIYSSDGRAVRKLREETPSEFASGTEPVDWDFKDDRGGVVPGGIYIIAAAAGPGRGAPKNTVKAAFAVAR